MRLVSDVEEWRALAESERRAGRRVGLVPTMGALHAGHLSLFEAAKTHGDVVIATTFVNPRQFDSQHDLARYPRTPDVDRALAVARRVRTGQIAVNGFGPGGAPFGGFKQSGFGRESGGIIGIRQYMEPKAMGLPA